MQKLHADVWVMNRVDGVNIGGIDKLVADLTLDNAILKEATGGTSEPVAEAEGSEVGLRKPSDLPPAGMQGVRAGSIDSAA